MKITLPLIATLACLTAGACLADEWATLSGVTDRIALKPGQTALITAVSGPVTVRYQNSDQRYNWFRLRSDDKSCVTNVSSQRRDNAVVSQYSPFPLAGPGVVSLSTPGVVSMRITEPDVVVEPSAAPRPARVISRRWQRP